MRGSQWPMESAGVMAAVGAGVRGPPAATECCCGTASYGVCDASEEVGRLRCSRSVRNGRGLWSASFGATVAKSVYNGFGPGALEAGRVIEPKCLIQVKRRATAACPVRVALEDDGRLSLQAAVI